MNSWSENLVEKTSLSVEKLFTTAAEKEQEVLKYWREHEGEIQTMIAS